MPGGPRRLALRSASLVIPLVLVAACATPGVPDPTAPASADAAGAPAAPAATQRSPADLARTLGGAVWRVEVDGCGIESGGTAFVVAPDLLVTNRHVVAFDPTPTLVDRAGGRTLRGEVVGMGDEVDLAVIRVDAELSPVLKWAPTSLLAEGQPVVALGYPDPLNTFTVSPGTLNAFDVVDGVRVGIVSDESSDHGSSGGPLLTADGLVAGVVTEFLGGGTQNAGLSLTHDAVRAELAAILAAPRTFEEDCIGAVRGTDPILDRLWDLCADGRMWACDELYADAAGGSEYEWFGATCGDRVETDAWCTVEFDAPEVFSRGDDPDLDALWSTCAGDGAGWPGACDLLAALAPDASGYAEHGASCGARATGVGRCEDRFG